MMFIILREMCIWYERENFALSKLNNLLELLSKYIDNLKREEKF